MDTTPSISTLDQKWAEEYFEPRHNVNCRSWTVTLPVALRWWPGTTLYLHSKLVETRIS